jgi:hypothetical protein
MKARIATLLVGVVALSVSTLGQADTIRLAPTADGVVHDQQPFDGVPDTLFPVAANNIAFRPNFADGRAVMHFDVNSIKGLHVQKATLKLDIIGKETSGSPIIPIEVRGFNSNGRLKLNDFRRGTFVTVFDGVAAPFDVLVAIDVTNRVKSALATASGFVGFTFRTNTDGVISFGSLDTGPAPKLVILTE